METQTLELNIISANDLRKFNPFTSNIRPYVVVWISDATTAFPAQITPVAANGGRNPTWNHPLTFAVPSTVKTTHLTLHLEIRSRCVLVSDELIGEVRVPLSDLLRSTSVVSYPVMKPSGRQNGVVVLSTVSGEPVMGYPVNLYPPLPPPSAPPVPTEPRPMTGYPTIGGAGYGYRRRGSGYWYPGQMGYRCRSRFEWKPKKCRRTRWGAGCSTALDGALAELLTGSDRLQSRARIRKKMSRE